MGEIEHGPACIRERLVADDDRAGGEQGRELAGKPFAEPQAGLAVARTDIDVSENGAGSEALGGKGDCRLELAEKHVLTDGNAVRMGGDLPVETVDVPIGQLSPQMIEGPSVAESEFQNVPRRTGDKC